MGNLGQLGIGEIFKDRVGAHHLLSYAGPSGLCLVNETELIVFRMGCREDVRLGLCNIIAEADSFFTINWASSSSNPPRHLVDISEDVLELSSRLGVTFSHVKQSANDVVGGLDRKEWGKRLWLLRLSFL